MRVKRWPIVFLFGAALLLSGCFKVNARIEVRPDGSGQWLIGWAMNQDLRRWSSLSEGSQLNTAELLKRFQGEGISLTVQDLKVREWTEGEFVWQEVSLPFRNPEELNTLAMRSERSELHPLGALSQFQGGAHCAHSMFTSDRRHNGHIRPTRIGLMRCTGLFRPTPVSPTWQVG